MRRLLALLAVGVLLVWPVGFIVYNMEIALEAPPAPQADGIVVLTGGGERVAVGLRLLQQGSAGRLLISGVGRAVSLRDLAVASGIDPAVLAGAADQVTLGRVADSTRGNALETADWVAQSRVRSLIVVTAYYHMPRALAELRAHLPNVALIAYPVHPPKPHNMSPAVAWRRLVGEYNKFLVVTLGLEGLAEWFGVGLSEHAG
ncbi:MAG: YdcF family protein [Acetobacteraceae bacterium]|nr:YdcF family protein [Acetobacteraceae bacterium]